MTENKLFSTKSLFASIVAFVLAMAICAPSAYADNEADDQALQKEKETTLAIDNNKEKVISGNEASSTEEAIESEGEGDDDSLDGSGWQTINGNRYYIMSDGSKATDWQIIQGDWYFFNTATGVMQTNKWVASIYWVGSDGKMAMDTWVDSGRYYVDSEGVCVKNGWATDLGTKCYLKDYKKVKNTWIQNGGWYYFDGQGKMVTDQWVGDYWMSSNGKMATNAWVDNKQYAVGSNGARVNSGWVLADKYWYYMKASKPVTNTWIGNYWLGEDGKMATNAWVDDDKYYVGSNGAWIANGWATVGSDWVYLKNNKPVKNTWVGNYWLGEDGIMATNAWVDGNKYYVGSNGVWVNTGWAKTLDGEKCYLKSNKMVTGWLSLGGTWYYFDSKGVMQTGFVKVSGTEYYLDNNGKMAANDWVKMPDDTYRYASSNGSFTAYSRLNSEGKRVLVDKDGNVLGGKQTIGGVTFYADANGVLREGWVDGKFYDSRGVMSTGWQLITDKNDGKEYWYYFNNSGVKQTGWVKPSGTWYYLKSDGKMAENEWITDKGTSYYLKSGGAMAANQWITEGKVSYYVNGSGAYVKSESNLTARAYNRSSSTNWLLVVNRSTCQVGVFYGSYHNWTLRYLWSCVTGQPGHTTPGGNYSVGNKGTNFGENHGYTCWYWTQFNKSVLFHSQLYYPGTFNILDGRMGGNYSQGCVRLELANAKWIYDNIPRGTAVHVY